MLSTLNKYPIRKEDDDASRRMFCKVKGVVSIAAKIRNFTNLIFIFCFNKLRHRNKQTTSLSFKYKTITCGY